MVDCGTFPKGIRSLWKGDRLRRLITSSFFLFGWTVIVLHRFVSSLGCGLCLSFAIVSFAAMVDWLLFCFGLVCADAREIHTKCGDTAKLGAIGLGALSFVCTYYFISVSSPILLVAPSVAPSHSPSPTAQLLHARISYLLITQAYNFTYSDYLLSSETRTRHEVLYGTGSA